MQRVGFSVRILDKKAAGIAKGFCVRLLRVPEAAKLAFHAVEITVAVAVR
jgi:hypothetical protein